jgi:hypothetical protein
MIQGKSGAKQDITQMKWSREKENFRVGWVFSRTGQRDLPGLSGICVIEAISA